MKCYGRNVGGVIFAEINGKIWSGYEAGIMTNPPCDCCVPYWMQDLMRNDGIVFSEDVRKDNSKEKSASFYHDRSGLPTNEEWEEVLLLLPSARDDLKK